MYSKISKFALTFVIFIASLTRQAQCDIQQQQQPVYNRGNRFGAAASRSNRTSSSQFGTAYASHNCEYKDLMTQLNDRVGVLASLDEDQRNRLESIDKKIVQFEESNLARLDALAVQMTDVNKRIDIVEHLQRMNNRQVDTLKGEFVALTQQQQQLEKAAGHVNDIILSRNARQTAAAETDDQMSAGPNMNEFRLDCSGKLESIATLLASTAGNVRMLHMQLGSNMTRLLQSTGALQRRFNNLSRRQQIGGQGYPPVQPNFYSTVDSHQLITSCALSQSAGTGGVQKLQLTTDSLPFYVLCDEEIQGGGWTVIQHRFSGEVNFQRDWQEYKNGFGNLAGEFFIGLDKLHALTASSVNELLILMMDKDNEQRFAKYSLFAIGSEKELYALSLLGTYSGNAGDSFSYHAGSKFSTFDNDNDGWVEGNCAQAHTGAWWYNACEQSNLNGQYLNGEYEKSLTFQGMYWHDFHGPNYALKSVKMMVRPIGGEYRR